MTHAGYIAAGWAVGVLGLTAYASAVLLRGRRLSKSVPFSRRRWMQAEENDEEKADE